MRVCYVDEARCLGMLPSATSPIQPVFDIAGVSLPMDRLNDVTREFLGIKRRFFPGLSPGSYLDTVLSGVTGADPRRSVAEGSRNQRRETLGLIDKVPGLLTKSGVRIFGRLDNRGFW